MIRRQRDSWEGFQVLLDHRESGGIGGIGGNGLASFAAPVLAEGACSNHALFLTEDDPVGIRAGCGAGLFGLLWGFVVTRCCGVPMQGCGPGLS